MIRSRVVRIQLAIFLVLTVVGVTVAGVRYVGIGEEMFGDRYRVHANFADAGGAFEGSQVTYRGVTVGEVERLQPTRNGVRATLLLDGEPRIPDDASATVANRSAIGEQYVDLEPGRDSGPYLSDHDRPVIPRERTAIPLSTNKLIYDLDNLVDSVPKEDLSTVIDELGTAFSGTGQDLSRIVDSGNSLIETADDHLDETIGLLENSSRVLATQRESGSSIRNFSKDLGDLSEAVADSDSDVRSVLDNGVRTAEQLDGLVQDNEDDVPALLTNLTTGGEIVRARLDGVQHVLIIYPYVVRGGYTVIDKDPKTGNYTAHFGMALSAGPRACREGYEGTEKRQPERTGSGKTNTDAHCEDPDTNMRGVQHAPAPDEEEPVPGSDRDGGQDEGGRDGRDGGDNDGGDGGGDGQSRERPQDDGDDEPRSSGVGASAGGAGNPLIAPYDPVTGKVEFADGTSTSVGTTGGQAEAFGEDSWKWLLLGPLAG